MPEEIVFEMHEIERKLDLSSNQGVVASNPCRPITTHS